ncbi:oxidoreductase [Xylariomycetidae sp. FL0641]|nr:oxidoreductase [Xylariomycetidae sp. FL0641]
MSKPWIFISGSSGGLGHAVTRRLLAGTRVPILATARGDPEPVRASLLASLSPSSSAAAERLHVLPLDVTDEASIRAAAAAAARLFPPATHHLHLALALAGVLRPERSPARVDAAAALATFRVNALGPLLLMKWFGEFLPTRRRRGPTEEELCRVPPLVEGTWGDEGEDEVLVSLPRDHATWLTASARVGSTADNGGPGGWYSYRASKAGVVSLTRTFDLHLRRRSGARALALAYHPGTVRTGLSREFWDRVPAAQLFEPDFAAAKLLEVVGRTGEAERGRCWDWKGTEVLP